MAKYCRKCGAPMQEGHKFCRVCGTAGVSPAPAPVPAGKPAERSLPQQSSQRKSKLGTVLAVALSVIMAVEGVVLGVNFKDWFGNDSDGTRKSGTTDSGTNDTDIPKRVMTPVRADEETLEQFGVTQEQLDEFYSQPIEINTDNSPGNPALIDVSFTQEEIDSAETASAEVSVADPVAKFPQFDMTVDMKWWNLENEKDTLTVKRLPVKTDEKTGATLYTYDFSLASGQNEFPAEVEVTAPVQGDVSDLEGFVHKDSDSSDWEEDYYTLSEDGKYYTVCMTHFSWSSQLESDAKVSELRRKGNAANRLYNESDGTSLFRIMPYQDLSKYSGSTNTWLYAVGLTKIPDFEIYLKAEDKYTAEALTGLLDRTGGITPEAGAAAAAGAVGVANDTTAFADLLKNGPFVTSVPVVGILTSTAGIALLYVRIADQIQRGVKAEKILSSNIDNIMGTVLGTVGTTAGIISLAAAAETLSAAAFCIAAVCAILGGVLYIKTMTVDKVYGWYESVEKEKHPLGYGKNLEENAFFYYLSEYDDDSECAPGRILETVIKKVPPTDGLPDADGHDTKLNIRGTGWAQAFNFIFCHYREKPEELVKATLMLYSEFEKYIDRFWEDSDEMAKVREKCWREFCYKELANNPELSKYTSDYEYQRYFVFQEASQEEYAIMDGLQRRFGGIDRQELKRWIDLIRAARSAAKQFNADSDTVWLNVNNPDLVFTGIPEYTKADQLRFDSLGQDKTDELKKYAKEIMYCNTNEVVNAYYKKQYDDAVTALRMELYQNILPLFNTHVTFYMKDNAVKENDMTQSADMTYDTFSFRSILGKQFDPANAGEGTHTDDYPLELKRTKGSPILLETNLYHYLRYGCPTGVVIEDSTGASSMINGEADWSNVRIIADPNSQYNTVPEEKQSEYAKDIASHYYFSDPSVFLTAVRDLKVPIVYTGRAMSAAKSASLYLNSYKGDTFYEDTPTGSVSVNSDGTFSITVPSHSTHYSGYEGGSQEKSETTQYQGFTVTGKLNGKTESKSDYGSFSYGIVTSAPSSLKISSTFETTVQERNANGDWETRPYVVKSTNQLSNIQTPKEDVGYYDTHVKIEFDKLGKIIGASILLNGDETFSNTVNGTPSSKNDYGSSEWKFSFKNEKPT